MLVIAIVLLIIWTIFYIRNGYLQAQNLKSSFDKDPDQTIKEYDDQIKKYQASIQDLKKQLHNVKALPSSFSNKHQANKIEKQIKKLSKQIESLKDEENQYLVLLVEYRESNMQDPEAKKNLVNWLKKH